VPYASLPEDGEAVVGGVRLPAGQRVSGFSGDVVVWATDEPLAGAGPTWLALSAASEQTGLVPILLAGLDGDTHLHVSFDVDFLDPDIAPGVGTQVRGGPTYREAQLCMEMIADTRRLASLDVVELNPAFDVCNRTAKLAVDLIESLFGKSTLVRRPVWRRPAKPRATLERRGSSHAASEPTT